MNNIRINNIECREYKPSKTSGEIYDIIKWVNNTFYGKENELMEEGYEWFVGKNGEMYLGKDNISINNKCFKNPESCVVIARLKFDDEGFPYMETVGDSLLCLDESEHKSFMDVYRKADEKLKQKKHLIDLMNYD